MSSASQRPNENEEAPNAADVHGARTAVAPIPTTLLDELRRAKRAARPQSFTDEAPTVPGKHGMRALRPLAPDIADVPASSPSESLAGAMLAALEEPRTSKEPSGLLALPPPPPAAATVGQPSQEAHVARAQPRLSVALVIVASTGIVLAIVSIAEALSRW